MNLANKLVYPNLPLGHFGLSLRELYAGLALQGVLANPESADVMPTVAKKNGIQMAVAYAMVAVEYADALIEQLEKDAATTTKP